MKGGWGHITDELYILFSPTKQRLLAFPPYSLPFRVWAGAPKFNLISPVVGLGLNTPYDVLAGWLAGWLVAG